MTTSIPCRTVAGILAALLGSATASGQAEDKLNVCCTVQSIASLAEEVGGPEVEVTSFAKGSEASVHLAFRQFAPVRTRHKPMMEIAWLGQRKQILQQALDAGGKIKIHAAHHVADAL